MGLGKFKIEKELQEKLKEKWSEFTIDVMDFTFGPNKIQIETRIATEVLNKDKKEVKEIFEGLCIAFTKVCHDHKIPCDPLEIIIAIEDELLNRPASVKMGDKVNERDFGLILFTQNGFKLGFWPLTFLHELGHCWLSEKPDWKPSSKEELANMELLIDLIAICAFQKVVPPHKRIFREAIKHATYFGTQANKDFLGTKVHKEILENPEAYLRRMTDINRR